MSEIAGAAGISKSLLFYYFQNKKELYLFLWNQCAKETVECLTAYGCYEESNLFDMMYREMYWASEGYLWEMMQKGELDTAQVEKDFSRMIDFWRSIYMKKEV